MIRSKKTVRTVVALAGVAALSLTAACGSSDNKDNKGSSSGKSALCGKNLAFLGALTGDAGALGLSHRLEVSGEPPDLTRSLLDPAFERILERS